MLYCGLPYLRFADEAVGWVGARRWGKGRRQFLHVKDIWYLNAGLYCAPVHLGVPFSWSLNEKRQLSRWILRKGRNSVMGRCVSQTVEYRTGVLNLHTWPRGCWGGSRPGANVRPPDEWWAGDWRQKEQCGKARGLGGMPLQEQRGEGHREAWNKGWVKGMRAAENHLCPRTPGNRGLHFLGAREPTEVQQVTSNIIREGKGMERNVKTFLKEKKSCFQLFMNKECFRNMIKIIGTTEKKLVKRFLRIYIL